jgi:hypothetical protein
MTEVAELQMTEKRSGRPKRSQRKDVSVKIDAEIVEKAKLVALVRHMPLAELLSEILRSPIDKEYNKETKRLGGSGELWGFPILLQTPLSLFVITDLA